MHHACHGGLVCTWVIEKEKYDSNGDFGIDHDFAHMVMGGKQGLIGQVCVLEINLYLLATTIFFHIIILCGFSLPVN